jgi:hypothetical protein
MAVIGRTRAESLCANRLRPSMPWRQPAPPGGVRPARTTTSGAKRGFLDKKLNNSGLESRIDRSF